MTVRILALVGDAYGARGGIAQYNRDLFGALAATGAEILVLPRLGVLNGEMLPTGVEQWAPRFGRLSFSLAALGAAWRFRPVDVVFCGHAYMAPLAAVLACLLGARYWLQAHGVEIWRDRRSVVRWAIEAADQVTAVSRSTRKRLLSWVDLAPEQVRVLPNTVDERFTPGPPSAALREHLKTGSGPILLAVGRLSAAERYKGHEVVFAAVAELRARFPGLVYAVAGEGDDRARLEARAREQTGDASVVRFLGYVPDEDLPDLYRLADLFVMPSSEEGFGIVYLEAAACGLRVIGGAGGGSGDAIPRGVGAIVDPTDHAGLIETVTRLLAQGRVDPVAIEPYRRVHFAATARLLLARLLAQPRHMRDTA
jgi:phosphatidylinositol alpha-1,6-mannosyltransferase